MQAEKDVRTLRGMLKLNQTCEQRFDQAERLAYGLFGRDDCVQLPYFTPHDASHCQAVERHMDRIIWGGGEPGQYDFVPAPEEAMYLLSAIWLHDIGMMYGIFPGEHPADLADDTLRIMGVRNEHEMRTLRYIRDIWRLECHWSPDQRIWLSNVCVYHRRHHPIATFSPLQIVSGHDQRPIRLAVLAALLRLADSCHEDQSRAPGQLMALYTSLGMPGEAAAHWESAKLVAGVDFDHVHRKIALTGCCPPKRKYDFCEFDLGEIVGIVRQDIEDELQSVQQVLLRYPNTYFGSVTAEVSHPLGLDEDEQYVALWPYLLDKPSGSTESAAALAHMLLFAIGGKAKATGATKAWKQSTLLRIMDKTQESRFGDFMIRNLCQNVKPRLAACAAGQESVESVTAYLEDFVKGIGESCRKIVGLGPGLIDPDDMLIIHGYCRNIAEFLRALHPARRNALYIVDYQEPIDKVRLGPSQNTRMRDFARDAGFTNVGFVPLAALPQALSELRHKNTASKVLLGAHGVLNSRDLLCKVGSRVLVATAKQFGAQVIAFAERPKFLAAGDSDADVINVLSSGQTWKRYPTMADTMHLTPEIDVVPKEHIDMVLTELGPLRPDTVVSPVGQPASTPAGETKGSSQA